MNKKYLLIGLTVLGLIGTVVFFPVNIGNHHTCLFHRFMDDSTYLSGTNMPGHSEGEHHLILSAYLKSYAYFWWMSILLFALGIYLRKCNKHLINF